MTKKVSVKTIRELTKILEVNEPKVIDFEGIKVEIKQYLPIEEKRIIIELVVQNSLIYEEYKKLNRIDGAVREVMFGYLIVKHYTNINLMNDPFEMYDTLVVTGLYDEIINNIPELEFGSLLNLLNDRMEEEFRLSELELSIGHKLEDTLGVLNRKMAEAIETITKFDPSQLQMLTSFMDEAKDKPVLDIAGRDESE